MAGKLKTAFQNFNNRLFDPGTLSDENVSRNRQMADMLLNQVSTPQVQHPLQGYAVLAQALNAQAYRQRANKGESALKERRAKQMGDFLSNFDPAMQKVLGDLPQEMQPQAAGLAVQKLFETPPEPKDLRTPIQREYDREVAKGNFDGTLTEYKLQFKTPGTTVNVGDKGPNLPDAPVISLFKEREEGARSSQVKYNAATEAEKLLDEGVFTGFGAEVAQQGARIMLALTDPSNTFEDVKPMFEKLKNTEAYKAQGGVLVGSIIRLFGSGTGLSDADREYAAMIAGALNDMSEPGLRQILGGIQAQSEAEITQYNSALQNASAIPGLGSLFTPIELKQKSADDWVQHYLGNP